MASTQITVADAEEQLGSFTPAGMTFLQVLNQATSRLVTSGKWPGIFVSVAFPAASGFITLPPRYLSVLAGTFDRFPVLAFSQWFDYQEIGICDPNDALQWGGRLQDLGDGFVTQAAMPLPGAIRIYSTGSDNGKTVRLFGTRTETGLPVVDNAGNEGEAIVLNAPFVQSLYHYDDLTGFQKEKTNGPVQAKVLPMNGDPEYQVAAYEPYETRPSYRRYAVGAGEKTIRVLCQRRWLAAYAPTDFVWPPSMAALQHAIAGIGYERTGYNDSAIQEWDRAFYWLNQLAKAERGGNQIPIRFDAFGWGNGIPFSN